MQIIEKYNIICEIKNQKFSIVQIKFSFEEYNIILVSDPNDVKVMTYKDIYQICVKTKIEFRNQSFGSIVCALKDRFF